MTRDSETIATPGEDGPQALVRVTLYDANGTDRDLPLERIDVRQLQEHQLLWVDVESIDQDLMKRIGQGLGLPADAITALQQMNGTPHVVNHGECFLVQVVAVEQEGGLQFKGNALGIAAGGNFVLSVHQKPIGFLTALRERERGDTELGALSAESFTASLLDWQLSTYFDAVSGFEASVERLEIEILSDRQRHCVDDLRNLRRAASRLRRMLAPHRGVYSGLARPDFRPRSSDTVNQHFHGLATHFERAMDAVENTRDLMVGSFQLFSSQTALRTNEAMRVLTFVTVLIGTLAVVAGVLGMNFEVPFFASGSTGFWWTLGGMAGVVVLAVVVARRFRWL